MKRLMIAQMHVTLQRAAALPFAARKPLAEALPFSVVAKIAVMGTAEIAARLGISTRRAHQLAHTKGFPEPAAKLTIGVIWMTADVEVWIRRHRPELAKR